MTKTEASDIANHVAGCQCELCWPNYPAPKVRCETCAFSGRPGYYRRVIAQSPPGRPRGAHLGPYEPCPDCGRLQKMSPNRVGISPEDGRKYAKAFIKL